MMHEMIRYVNPLKVFVYSSLNLPVVSTEIENLGKMRELIYIAQDQEEDFVRKVELALEEERNGVPSTEHMELLRRNSWEERGETILQSIEEEFSAAPDHTTLRTGVGWIPKQK